MAERAIIAHGGRGGGRVAVGCPARVDVDFAASAGSAATGLQGKGCSGLPAPANPVQAPPIAADTAA